MTKTQLQTNSQPETSHIKKALRATLILFPLLGITNLLFFLNPKDGKHEKIYMLFNSSMQSSQVKMKFLNTTWLSTSLLPFFIRASSLRFYTAFVTPRFK